MKVGNNQSESVVEILTEHATKKGTDDNETRKCFAEQVTGW